MEADGEESGGEEEDVGSVEEVGVVAKWLEEGENGARTVGVGEVEGAAAAVGEVRGVDASGVGVVAV